MEALESLLVSEGWQVFFNHFLTEWGPAQFRAKVRQALSRARNKAEGEDYVAQVESATNAVETLLHWPEERIKQLKQAKPEVPYSVTHL